MPIYTYSELLTIKERFWQNVNKTDHNACWNYRAAHDKLGYGIITNGRKKRYLTHRVSYVLTTRESLESKDFICHTCDNPSCCNPNHLFRGDIYINMADKVAKGRQHRNRKYAEEDIKLAFRLATEGYRQKDIMKITKLPRHVLDDALNGRTWTTVQPENFVYRAKRER